jgi:hypothetical protein
MSKSTQTTLSGELGEIRCGGVVIPLRAGCCFYCEGKEWCPHSETPEGKAIVEARTSGRSQGCYKLKGGHTE